MRYDVTLIEADIADAMHGKMRLGLDHEGVRAAELAYDWDEQHFTATFLGDARRLPKPAPPIALLSKPIMALYAQRKEHHRVLSDVFNDNIITIETE